MAACHRCGAAVTVERRQFVADDPGEPPGTEVWECTDQHCGARTIVYSDID